MLRLVPTAVVAGTGPVLSGVSDLIRRSSSFELLSVLDLAAAGERGWHELLAAPGVDLVVLDASGPDRLRRVRQLAEAGKAVLLCEPFPLLTEELDGLLSIERESERPIGVLAPHRALLDDATRAHTWGPKTSAVLVVSAYRPVEAHRWARWAPVAEVPTTAAALCEAAPYLDLVCQLLGEPRDVRSLGPGAGVEVGIADFVGGARLAFSGTSRASIGVERLDLLDTGHRLRVEDGRSWLEGPAGLRAGGPLSLPDAHEVVLAEMAGAINSFDTLRHCSLAAGRGLAMLLGS
ncbi:hypothetical protein [Streptomyces sp. NPDC013181]|uniref:hypothetical protein n=1 Tax=unclassified Streptomyces TaxID=2593676 RepID=UPI0036C086B4